MTTATNQKLKRQIIDVCKWSVCLPALAFWPIVSVMPAFAIVGQSTSGLILPNIMFLMTGFWPVIIGVAAYRFVTGRMARAGMPTQPGPGGIALGAFATVWTAAYGIFVLLGG